MVETSRREFLTGVLACGALSAGAIYLLPGGRPLSHVELRLVTGADPTGARELLLDMWNQANPATRVAPEVVSAETGDQRTAMEEAARNNDADIVNLDIIHIPHFIDRGLITPIELDNPGTFLPPALLASRVDNDLDRHWAAPFNTDVGMLFERLPDVRADTSGQTLAEVVDGAPPNQSDGGSGKFVGQLQPTSSTSEEAFVVNVLEHALSRDEGILDVGGRPDYELNNWAAALEPLRAAIAQQRIVLSDTETDSRIRFTTAALQFMRNWPVKYRELQQARDPDAIASRLLVGPLPIGILGGQSLAVVKGSRHAGRAEELIRFLTGNEAQKVLAAHGLAPTRIAAYNDADLQAFTPHLDAIRGAVERARPRPLHPNYHEFSGAVARHVGDLLHADIDLPSQFIDEMRSALA